jgi:uncharacterized membrane protein
MSIPRIAYGALAVSSVLVALSTVRVVFAPLALVMPAMAHYLPEIPGPLFAHIIFGPLALALMPFQFWSGLRSKRPALHRGLGYGYVISVLIAALAALALLPRFLGTGFGALGFLLLALVWIGCTGQAVLAARKGDYAAHRLWMIRSAALTFGAVTLRLQLPVLFAAGYTLPTAYDLLAWDSWLPNLILVELWHNAKRRTLRRAV